MERVKFNKICIITTLICLILMLTVPALLKVNNDHRKHLYNCVIDEVKIAALKCYYEDNCSNVITLQELYDLKYLETISNPLTKEIYSASTTIEIKGNTAVFNG